MPSSESKPLRLRKLDGRPAPCPPVVVGDEGVGRSAAPFIVRVGRTAGSPVRFRRVCSGRGDMGMFRGTPDEAPVLPGAIAETRRAGA